MLASLQLNGSTIYSTLDLSSAYHKITLTEKFKGITVFITPEGLFRYTRVPFELASASSLFQRMMDRIFKCMDGILYFQDDIFLHAKSKDEHDKLRRTVLSKLRHHDLTIKREKCKIGVSSVEYLGQTLSSKGIQPKLGHTLSSKGIQPKESLITAVTNAPTPVDKDQLRSFLGLCKYMSKFVPFRELMKDRKTFTWEHQHRNSFECIKREIGNRIALYSFDSSSSVETIVTTDASNYGLGATLSQVVSNQERIVSFISRTLTDTEKKYSVIEKEMLACYWATKRLRTFLWGRHFKIRTDHKPLIYILSTRGYSSERTSSRINRWSSRMLEYNYTATYTPGSLNVLADCMSRLPMTDESEDDTDESTDDTELEYIAQISTIADGMITDTEFKEACTNDSDLQNVLSYISTYWPNFNQLTPELKVFHRVRYELSTRDGILFRHDRLVVPKALQGRIIHIAHTGHFGMTLVKRRIRQFYWWPTMDTMIDHVIKNCVHCNTSDKPYQYIAAPLTPIPLPERVWQKLALDIQGPYLEAKAQHKFVIVMVDFYSKWIEVKFCSTVTTEVVIEFLSNVFYREGIPETLVTDNGVQFVSYRMKEFLQTNNITYLRSSLYHPKTNGLVERVNKTIKEGIQLSKSEHRSPVEVTKERLQVYHSTTHTSTGITPFTLVRGRTVHTQLTIPKFLLNSTKNPALISKVQRYQD
ncbi:hypothetical protein SNE40_020751 [Patella caerulea]|uniref:Uncharacterized protein n=1 Tax=Patella caerulea TaxID=87958 RepID=A0AAN8J5A9_PATCE